MRVFDAMVFGLLVLALGQASTLEDSLDAMFSDGKYGYYLSPTRCISDASVSQVLWSSDSSRVAFIRTPPMSLEQTLASELNPVQPIKREIVVWNAKDRTSKVLLNVESSPRFGIYLSFSGTQEVLVQLDQLVENQLQAIAYLIDCGSQQTARWVLPPLTNVVPSASASNRFATMTTQIAPGEYLMHLVSSAGSEKSYRFSLPASVYKLSFAPGMEVSEDGRTARGMIRRVPSNAVNAFEYIVLDLSSGATTRKTEEGRGLPLSPEAELHRIKLQRSGRSRGDNNWFIEAGGTSGFERAVVSTDAVQADLSPNNAYVSFVSRGALLVRSISKVDLEKLENLRDEALKAQAIKTAKQVATAMAIYSSDYDIFVPNNSDWRDHLGPYLKDRDLANRFEYTFGGGNASDVQKPSETELGYVSGPGGRAVAYVDGHVRWIPNPPKRGLVLRRAFPQLIAR